MRRATPAEAHQAPPQRRRWSMRDYKPLWLTRLLAYRMRACYCLSASANRRASQETYSEGGSVEVQETNGQQETGNDMSDGRSSQRQPGAENRQTSAIRIPSKASARWLRILQQVTEGAISHLDMQELLRELLDRIRDAMGVDNAAILLVNADGAHFDLYAARGSEEDVGDAAQVQIGRGVAGTIAARRTAMIINDLSEVEAENPLLRATAHSLVGAPLLIGDRVIGVIHIDSASPRQFTEEDSQLLQVIASRVALAIEHAQLYEAERAARQKAEALTRQLQTLQTVSDVALEYVQLDELLRALLPRIQQILEVDNVAILLPTADEKNLTLYNVRGPEEAVIGKVLIPMGQGVAGLIAATRQPLAVENLAAVPVANAFLREHFHSLLGVPLLSGERLIGVIHVDTFEFRHFTEEDTQMLQTLAERIATAIARSQQYERAQHGRVKAERHAAALQDTMERLDEFLSLASHELRTPITSLAMNIQLIEYWLDAERPRRAGEPEGEYLSRAVATVRPFLKRSDRSVKRLNRLIGDLLDATYIREERLALRPQRIDLVAVAREVVEEQRQIHTTRTLAFKAEGPESLSVDGDLDRIAQVMHNYIGNAIKYSDPDEPVTVITQVAGDQARFVVRDVGVGIPDAELEHIWERLYRVAGIEHQSGSRIGLGLGLYISRDIIERHGGQVGVQSAPGEGSTFWFTLPLARPHED